jgi:hypothetical protein
MHGEAPIVLQTLPNPDMSEISLVKDDWTMPTSVTVEYAAWSESYRYAN